MEKLELQNYVYIVGVTISNRFIGYVENSVGNPIYVKEVNNAIIFDSKTKGYEFEEKIRHSIGKQKQTTVQTFQVLKEKTEEGAFSYTILGVV